MKRQPPVANALVRQEKPGASRSAAPNSWLAAASFLAKILPKLYRQSQNFVLSFNRLRQNFTVSLPFSEKLHEPVHLYGLLPRFSHFCASHSGHKSLPSSQLQMPESKSAGFSILSPPFRSIPLYSAQGLLIPIQ
jgi:hypothetical protein